MEFILADPNDRGKTHSDLKIIDEVLNKSYQYWKGGSGESAVQIKNDEMLIFFKVEEGVFIMFHPEYSSPVISKSSDKANTLIHYVGGEKMLIPDVCIADENTASNIIKYYITTGKLLPEFEWKDIYELIECEI